MAIKITNKEGQSKFVNTAGIKMAEAFLSKEKETAEGKKPGEWYIKITYSNDPNPAFVGPFANEAACEENISKLF